MIKEIYKDNSKTIRKGVIIYALVGNVHTPLAYIHRPKFRTEEEFDLFIKHMVLAVDLQGLNADLEKIGKNER